MKLYFPFFSMKLQSLNKCLKVISTISIATIFLTLSACKDNDAAKKAEAERFINSAKTYQGQGQYRAALLETKNAIQKDPSNPESFILQAKIYNQIGSYTSTQKLLEETVKKMPSATLELAEAYVASNKYRSALSVLNEYKPANLSNDDQARKYALIAKSNIRLGDKTGYQAAIDSLKKIQGKEDDVTLLEAEYLVSQGQIEAAQLKLDSLTTGSKENVKALIMLGTFSLQHNQLPKAEDYFTKALSLIPNSDIFTIDKTIVLTQLTEALIQQGRTSEAYRYQKLLADANPESQAAQQKFNDAMEYYRQGKFAEAEKILAELREQYPQDKNSAVLLGLVQFQQGQDQQASKLFDKFIDPETANSSVIQAAALAKYRSNQMDEAVALLKKAVESQPGNAEILATYGLALLDREPQNEEGQKALEKSLALNPKQQRLRLALAKRHMALKQPEQALAQLQKAYLEQPLDLYIQQAYFKLLMDLNKDDELKAKISEFQTTYPDNPRGPFLEGWYKLSKKSYAESERAFERALAMKNKDERNLSYAGLAQVYMEQKLPQKAVMAWQSAIKEKPEVLDAYVPWLYQMRQLGRQPEAISFLTELEKNDGPWQTSIVLAQLLASEKQVDQAMKHIDIAMERSKGAESVKQFAANLYQAIAAEYRAKNMPNDAKTYLLKAIALFPKNVSYLAGLIETEIAAGNVVEAQKLLDQFENSTENAPTKLFLQARINVAANKPDEAIKNYLASWNLRQTEMGAEAIYDFYYKGNKKDEAAKFAKEWLEKLPNSSRANLIMAVEAQQSKNVGESVKLYEKTVELAPKNAAAMNNLAWLYYENKDPRALEVAKKAYDLAPTVPEIMDTYGWILVEAGKINEGIEYLEKASQAASNNAEIKDHLAKAKSRLK